jgi:RNA polymerase sigma-70 factor, ECF subfamily
MTEPSDEELAKAVQQGDDSAFGPLVERYQGRVYGIAYRYTGNREEALDVAQTALFRAYEKIGAWKPTGPFGGWMMRLTTNAAIDECRRLQKRRQRTVSEQDLNGYEPVARENPEEDARHREIDSRIREALAGLSPAQSQVFMLRHYDGMSLQEIADAMGCSLGSVKVHLFRALRKLREVLADDMEDLR